MSSHNEASHELPLANVRVLDFTRILSGPYCTQFLSELGADIIKIERPTVGDDTRSWGPPFIDDDEVISAYFAALNRGKFSVTLDFTDERGAAIVRSLAAKCDVVVENFRPGVAQRHGMNHARLAEINPAIVTCSISGFGSIGPYAYYPGTEIVVEGMSGLMSVTGSRNGEPVRFGVAMTDITTGLTAAAQIIAALSIARSTGVGTHIDTSLYATAIAALGTLVASTSVSGDVPERWGSHHPSIVPYGGFPTADGDVITGTVNDRMWPTLCRAIGVAHLLEDPELASNSGRVRQRDRVEKAIAEATVGFTTDGLVRILLDAGLLAAPIRSVSEMVHDSATRELGLLTNTAGYPNLLTTRLTGPGVDAGTQQIPSLGVDTATVLTELAGIDSATLDALRDAAVV
ncbi:CaiB/BaiF CoA transferase family protein [Rhodococcus sp. NPDC060176]|uniref:CaiB/BaiF CoA transferase family protein n=1 Tax=Rhodococcus sp. NPDC060176 TaxID=3347062 RepID=UPI0036510C7A